ncbi:cilia-and flagella-associated protein 96 [Lepus europaeus]|uniref:cilia-and flagella-associated protein 96 n=1 Tax=Lepus europaeus TaxID=9983 RepID=UPI002B4941A2|nr:cilia-and flagella-associated protein 96 [Lepus europaeus]XP_062069079.1 cilia-and flagella-associated protein 96 [Lepus europaeus]
MPLEGGKTDMERIGLFSEMEYITVGDKYVSQFNRPFNEAASKNRQMLPGGSKGMSDLQAGYFDSQFGRIFEGEGYVNLNQVRRQHLMEEAKKNLGKAFLPSSGDKKPCGLGSYYGTIGGPIPFFSAQSKPREKYEAPGKNLYTNPGKKGTGYGYANITIGKQFSHSADFYDAPKVNYKKENEAHRRLLKGTPFKLNLYPKDYFDTNPYSFEKALPPIKKVEKKEVLSSPFKPSSPGKKAGGMKAGTFDPYPSHSADPYTVKLVKGISGKGGKIFHPPSGPKSRPIESIMTLNVKRALNSKNYKSASVQSY